VILSSECKSPERLKLLLVLTVADIRAVGPNVWNGWKAALLRELYHRAVEVMSGGLTVEGRDLRVATAQAAARRLLRDFSEEEFTTFAARGYPFYWLSFDPETHARHARLMREAAASGAPLTVGKTRRSTAIGDRDHPLHRRSRGPLLAHRRGAGDQRANIVDARIMTMSNGMALDTFWVQDLAGRPFDRPDKLARLA